jgi:hypothetical protein
VLKLLTQAAHYCFYTVGPRQIEKEREFFPSFVLIERVKAERVRGFSGFSFGSAVERNRGRREFERIVSYFLLKGYRPCKIERMRACFFFLQTEKEKRRVSAKNNRERRRSMLNVRGCTSIYSAMDGLD